MKPPIKRWKTRRPNNLSPCLVRTLTMGMCPVAGFVRSSGVRLTADRWPSVGPLHSGSALAKRLSACTL
jgi:hypothetical protein